MGSGLELGHRVFFLGSGLMGLRFRGSLFVRVFRYRGSLILGFSLGVKAYYRFRVRGGGHRVLGWTW